MVFTRKQQKAFNDEVVRLGRKFVTNAAKVAIIPAAKSAVTAGNKWAISKLQGSKVFPKISPGTSAKRGTRFQSNFGEGDRTRVIKRGSKKLSMKRKRSVKVSPKLRKKIKKVIDGSGLKGMTQEIETNSIRLLDASDNLQIVNDTTSMNNVTRTDPHFSNLKLMDALSVLWNEKALAQTKTETGNFDKLKAKFTVINSYAINRYRNNTQRKFYVTIMDVRPKSTSVQGDPLGVWGAELTNEAANQGPNQNTTNFNQLYLTPTMSPGFNKLFTVEYTKVEIGPGGEYKHYIQGPKNWEYNGMKSFNGSLYLPYNKASCWSLHIVHGDLVSLSNGGKGRYYSAGEASIPQLIVETQVRYYLEMPELAGFQGAAGATTTPLGQRQMSYACANYTPAQGAATIERIDPEELQPPTTQ